MFSYGSPQMAEQKHGDQLEPTYSISVRIQGVTLCICLKRWTIGRSGGTTWCCWWLCPVSKALNTLTVKKEIDPLSQIRCPVFCFWWRGSSYGDTGILEDTFIAITINYSHLIRPCAKNNQINNSVETTTRKYKYLCSMNKIPKPLDIK